MYLLQTWPTHIDSVSESEGTEMARSRAWVLERGAS